MCDACCSQGPPRGRLCGFEASAMGLVVPGSLSSEEQTDESDGDDLGTRKLATQALAPGTCVDQGKRSEMLERMNSHERHSKAKPPLVATRQASQTAKMGRCSRCSLPGCRLQRLFRSVVGPSRCSLLLHFLATVLPAAAASLVAAG